MTAPDQLVPFNVEAEQAVLGSCLLDRSAILRIMGDLKPDYFYREQHRWIYQCMLDLTNRRRPIDFILLRDELEETGLLDKCGGAAYLTSLINVVPTSIHIEYYAAIVIGGALRRRMIDAGQRLAQLAYRENEIEELLAEGQKLALDVTMPLQQRQGHGPRKIGATFDELLEVLATGRQQSLKTGIRLLDWVTRGFLPDDLIIVGGRPSMGKTALMVDIAAGVASQGKGVLIFTLEQGQDAYDQRFLAHQGRIDVTGLISRAEETPLPDDDLVEISRAMGRTGQLPVWIDDTPGISLAEITVRARQIHMQSPLSLILIDYLQLMGGSDARNRNDLLDGITRGLKTLARQMQIPVVLGSQLSRKVEERGDRRPLMSDLREAGGQEQDADKILFLYREVMYNAKYDKPNEAEINCAKNRSGGKTGMVKFYYDPTLHRFMEYVA